MNFNYGHFKKQNTLSENMSILNKLLNNITDNLRSLNDILENKNISSMDKLINKAKKFLKLKTDQADPLDNFSKEQIDEMLKKIQHNIKQDLNKYYEIGSKILNEINKQSNPGNTFTQNLTNKRNTLWSRKADNKYSGVLNEIDGWSFINFNKHSHDKFESLVEETLEIAQDFMKPSIAADITLSIITKIATEIEIYNKHSVSFMDKVLSIIRQDNDIIQKKYAYFESDQDKENSESPRSATKF